MESEKSKIPFSSFYIFFLLHVNNIPVFVICFIIKRVCSGYKDAKGFKHRLPPVAVNRKFRQAGMPTVYDYLFVMATVEFEDEDAGGGSCNRTEVFSNIYFYLAPERITFAKRVKLESQDLPRLLKGPLKPVIDGCLWVILLLL